MKTATSAVPASLAEPPVEEFAAPDLRAWCRAHVALTKPRIGLMVLITVGVGYLMGSRVAAPGSSWTFLYALVGTGLVASGASSWNQLLERFSDARMRRTSSRPLPSGKVEPIEAATFGTVLTFIGLVMLWKGTNPVASAAAALTFVLYVFVYTPLKPVTTLNTLIGAIPGALPPVIGWTAATGRLGVEAGVLFLIMFLWQFPHFMAIAWIYRHDYDRGGLRMVSCDDPAGRETGRQAFWYAVALVPAVLLPWGLGFAGLVYAIGALGLSVAYLVASARFRSAVADSTARALLRMSFLHLPGTLLLLVLNPVAG